MRPQFLNKKLLLNKTTIADLTQTQMRRIHGGEKPAGITTTRTDQEVVSNAGCVDSTFTYYTCIPWTCTCQHPINMAPAYKNNQF